MSNSIAPGSSADVNVRVTALTTNTNVPAQYKTIILKKNLVNGVNTLTQEMMSAQNTKYVIKYDYVLSENITVPANCILDFDGGSLKNGTLIGNQTRIDAEVIKIFNTDISLVGTWNVAEAYTEWFGLTDYSSDCSSYINKAIQAAYSSGINVVRLQNKVYNISNPIILDQKVNIIGSVQNNAYQSDATVDGTKLLVNADINGIEISSDNGYMWDRVIKNIQIESTVSNSHSGILVYPSDGKMQMIGFIFENICCSHFYYGIKVEGLGYYGFSGCIFNRVRTIFNKIGFAVITEKGQDNRSTWMNHNEFNFCSFDSNTIGGIYIYGPSSTENNFFNYCSIENNGKDYNPEDLSDFAYYGFGIRVHTIVKYGIVYLTGCYIENNFPRRDGTPTSNEYEYENKVYPNDIETKSVAIITNNGISATKCKFSRNVLIFYGDSARISLYRNDYATGRFMDYADISNITIKILGKYDLVAGNENWCFLYIDEMWYNGTGDTRFNSLVDFVDFGGTIGLNTDKVNIYIKSPLNDTPIYVGRYKNSFAIHLGGTYKKTKTNLGFNKTYTLYDTTMLDNINTRLIDNILVCIVHGANYFTYQGNSIIRKPIVFKSANGVDNDSLQSGSYYKTFYNDVTFMNLKINNLTTDSTSPFIEMKGGSVVTFIDCTIRNASAVRELVKSDYPVTIIFNNCTFTFDDTMYHSFYCTYGIYNTVKYNNCTFPEGYTPIDLIKKGNTSSRPVFRNRDYYGYEYYDTTLNKPIWWNGTNWVDATGTSV